jgi:hypothetical protein
LSIGQLNALYQLDLNGCSNLKQLHLLVNWMHSKSFIGRNVSIWKNYFHLLVNWIHSKFLFIRSR